MNSSLPIVSVLVVLGCAATTACVDDDTITSLNVVNSNRLNAQVPSGLHQISSGGQQLTMYPYTSVDLGQTPSDPINLVFRGNVDPRRLRAALLALNGDRSVFGFPNVAPFNCTWSDAYGDLQSGYAEPNGFTASVVQLQCGTYDPIRFHLRLFPAGDWTIANAHFELMIPGTEQHQVLNWELAEQLVVLDFVRTGLLGADPEVVGGLNAPTPGNPAAPHQNRFVIKEIYNSMPAGLKQIVGGPAVATEDVPIQTDGNATLLFIAGAADWVVDTRSNAFIIAYDQVVPRPFCSAGPLDYVLVRGPLQFNHNVTQNADGKLIANLSVKGHLQITPINPLTGELGESATAVVDQIQHVAFGDHQMEAFSQQTQRETALSGGGTSLQWRLQVGSNSDYWRKEQCR